MLINEDPFSGQFTIQRFKPGELVINAVTYQRSVILTPDQVIADWPPQQFQELTLEHLTALLHYKPQVIVVGTGSQQHFIESKMLAALINRQIGVEVMGTLAACRTYNVLVSENRQVVAALLIR